MIMSTEEQSPGVALYKNCSETFSKSYKKTPGLESPRVCARVWARASVLIKLQYVSLFLLNENVTT